MRKTMSQIMQIIIFCLFLVPDIEIIIDNNTDER